MSEGQQQEVVEHSKQSEQWVEISDAINKQFNFDLREKKHSILESAGEGIIGEGDSRFGHITTALESSLNKIVQENLKRGGNPSVPVGIATAAITIGENGFLIFLIRQKGIGDNEYRIIRNELLKGADEILKLFDKEPLPPYTSQNRRKI